ncbi:MAG: class I SAM-dependent methyltransferase, partial [Pyrinomonadaceae bacterium]|nr:class I SAM-dependent methyltransferase [Pyrinomonadaceae bacterium]
MRRWLRSRPLRTRQQRERLLQNPALGADERALLKLIKTRISPNDGMYVGNGDHYFRVGLSAIHCIEQALSAAKMDKVTNALDLPCGHGRVLRFLLQRWPKTKFTACDLDLDGVDFCTQALGAEPAYSQRDLRALFLGQEFDLIWCGSLITHLDDMKIAALLDFFQRHLSPGGLVVFTAAGDRVVEWMVSGEFDYGI